MKTEYLLEKHFSALAQFQTLSLSVWITELIVLTSAIHYWQHSHVFDTRTALPLIHLVPWAMGLSEWKRLSGTSIKNGDQKDDARQPMIRVLWSTYFVIVLMEFAVFQ